MPPKMGCTQIDEICANIDADVQKPIDDAQCKRS